MRNDWGVITHALGYRDQTTSNKIIKLMLDSISMNFCVGPP